MAKNNDFDFNTDEPARRPRHRRDDDDDRPRPRRPTRSIPRPLKIGGIVVLSIIGLLLVVGFVQTVRESALPELPRDANNPQHAGKRFKGHGLEARQRTRPAAGGSDRFRLQDRAKDADVS